MEPPHGRIVEAKLDHPFRPRRASYYCGAYALWAEAMVQIQKYGTMVKSPTGYPMQSPYLGLANRQAELMMRIASEFAFTLASCSRISAPDQLPLLDLTTDDYEQDESERRG